MKTAIKTNLRSKTFCNIKDYTIFREKENDLFDLKFYQKLFVLLFSLSTILIIPESPKELENICENYNSIKLCNVF